MWMFAALSTVEPPIVEHFVAGFVERDKSWHRERLEIVDERIRKRLGELSQRLGEGEWLDGAFSAGDLLMISVLQRIKSSGILDEYANLAAYVARGEARPAYRRAFADQAGGFQSRIELIDTIARARTSGPRCALALRRDRFPQTCRIEAIAPLDHDPRAVFHLASPWIGGVAVRANPAAALKPL